MSMYNIAMIIRKKSEGLWQYYRDDPNDNIVYSESFKIKINVTLVAGQSKDVKIAKLLKFFSNFQRNLEMPLTNCKINLNLTSSENRVISSATRKTKFAKIQTTDTKLYVPVVTLSSQDNAKLLEQLKSGFIRIINQNKYQSKVSTERKKQYLDSLIDPSFQGVNRLFVSLFENEEDRNAHTAYYLPKIEIKDQSIMIDGENLFDHQVKSNMRACENIQKVTVGQGDDCTTACLLDYNNFNKHYKMIATDLSKQQVLDADPKPLK